MLKITDIVRFCTKCGKHAEALQIAFHRFECKKARDNGEVFLLFPLIYVSLR